MVANPDVEFASGDPAVWGLLLNTVATYHVLEAIRIQGFWREVFASTPAV